MPLEIERKFLVIGPLPLPRATKNIMQGYLPDDAKVAIEDEFLVINAMPHSTRAPRVKLPVTPWQAQDIRNGVINAVGARGNGVVRSLHPVCDVLLYFPPRQGAWGCGRILRG